ncbi:MAG: glycosyltransferase family 2 protein, partial [Patescibacteria group bacterium]
GSVETIRNFQTPCLAGRQANPKFQTNSNPPAGGPKIKLIENKKNLGFARGNNAARKIAKGKYVLFLNSDVILEKDTILKTLDYLEKHPRVSGITCRLELPNHRLDKDTRRSFPTPWVALSHFSRLDKLFPKSKLFARYWYSYIPENKIHKIEVAQGAYFLIRKDVLDQVGWFDQDYFLDGEDIDLCWKIKEAGWPIIYYPKAKAIHLKGASKGKSQKNRVHLEERKKFILAGVESMEIFYRKRLKDRYPSWLTGLIITGIKILGGIRILKLKRGLAN